MSAGRFAERYGPWALVAGASEGIGRQFSHQLAERGLNLVMVARRQELLDATAQEIRNAYGVEVRTATVDLADEKLMGELDPTLSDIEIGLLVYNAALSIAERFIDGSVESALEQLYVNCRGPLILTHALARRMAERGRGGVLLMSSAAGFVGSGTLATYAATKAFDTVLGEGLHQDLRSRGVDVLSFVASATRTPNMERQLVGLERGRVPVMEPEDVVRQAMDDLGTRAFSIAGRGNRLLVGLMVRLLPRSTVSRLMTRTTRRLFGLVD